MTKKIRRRRCNHCDDLFKPEARIHLMGLSEIEIVSEQKS